MCGEANCTRPLVDWTSQGQLTISRSSFSDITGEGAHFSLLHAEKGQIHIADSNFSGIRADYGGVAHFVGDVRVKVESSVFQQNEAESGGVFYMEDASSLEVVDSQLLRNRAELNGGVLVAQQEATVQLRGCEVRGNRAG